MGMRAAIMFMVPCLTAIVSCSIKEDRTDCPCWLTVNLENTSLEHPDMTHKDVTIAMWSPDLIRRERVTVADYGEERPYERSVPKGLVSLSAYAGRTKMVTQARKLIVSKGSQCDSIYAYSNLVDCTEEYASDDAVLHKEFATLLITMACNPDEQNSFGIRVRGNVNGFDTVDMSPLPGDFEFMSFGDGDLNNRFAVRVPRQQDSSLKLDVLGWEGVENTIDIGRYIEECGYSWDAPDLDDIRIDIEHASIIGQLQILPWEEESREFQLKD